MINGQDVEDVQALDDAVAQPGSSYLTMKVVRRQAFLTFKVLVPSSGGKLGINVEPFEFSA